MIAIELSRNGNQVALSAEERSSQVIMSVIDPDARRHVTGIMSLAEVEELRNALEVLAQCAGRGHDALPVGEPLPGDGRSRVYQCQRCGSEWREYS